MKNILCLMLIIAVTSCKKESPPPEDPRECFKNNQGNIFVDNLTKYPYRVWINGVDKGSVSSGSHILVAVRYDTNIPIRVVQESGYFINADQRTGVVDVEVCGETLFRFK